MKQLALIAVVLAVAGPVAAAPQNATPAAAPRVEVPIKEVILSDRSRRYVVQIKVGGAVIDAGLDTGSSGLRILPGVLADADAEATGSGDNYAYGSGADYRGVIGKATVSVGGLSGPTRVQLIRTVTCSAAKPNCPVSRVPLAQYGIQGDGLPGEGFKAILGINMADAEIPSLLSSLGAKRWIVELPRTGEGKPGRLILNPTPEELAGYVNLPIMSRYRSQQGGLHDAVYGCLLNDDTQAKACGAALLDCGAPGLRVVNGDVRQAWRPNTAATLAFYDGNGKAQAAEQLRIGQFGHASNMSVAEQPAPKDTVLYTGLTAYFAFSVAYDPAAETVGLKPRPQAKDGPLGVLTR